MTHPSLWPLVRCARATATAACTILVFGTAGCPESSAPTPDASDALVADATEDDTASADAATDVSVDAGPDAIPTTIAQAAAGLPVNVLDEAAVFAMSLGVTDDAGRPIAGAEVVVGGQVFAVTDGAARLTGLSVSASPVAVVRAPGYASSAIVLDPARTLSGFSVALRPFEAVETFSAASGGAVQLQGARIALAAGGVVTEDGGAYTGEVTLSAAAIDLDRDLLDPLGPVSALAAARLPDPLIVVSGEGGGAAESASMFKLASTVVELRGAAGQALQPAPGKPAEVEYRLSSSLAMVFPSAYQAGATLDVASRDEASGKWSVSSTCTVVEGPGGWSCTAQLPHFSESAVVKKSTDGCLVVGNIEFAVPEGQEIVWREQQILGPFETPVRGHYFDNGGKLGLCTVVPLSVETLFLVTRYQTAPTGTAARSAPSYAMGEAIVQTRFALGKPFDANLGAIEDLDTSTAAGCLRACATAPRLTAAFVVAPPAVPDPSVPVITPPPAEEPVALPVVDFSAVDSDQDGANAEVDCDDDDALRAPSFAEVCADGIDQDCDGRDPKCPITCFEAGNACVPACQTAHGEATAATFECVGKCTTDAPFVTAEAQAAWATLQTCMAGCTDASCTEVTCAEAFGACVGDDLYRPCGELAPCIYGCQPLFDAGMEAAAIDCLTACGPPRPEDEALISDLAACGALHDCPDTLSACSATPASPMSTCGPTDMTCYATQCDALFTQCVTP